jgi:hypothetical protein
MTPFATIAEYDVRFPGRTASDTTLAACLESATASIAEALDKAGIDWANPSESLSFRMMDVCRSVANRILPQEGTVDIPQGVTQTSITAVGFQQSYSFSPSYGVARLLPSELDLLGIGGGSYVYAEPYGGNHAGS